ncbi:MAG: cation-transporting P-type ATPase [Saprospiraceae bacterium]
MKPKEPLAKRSQHSSTAKTTQYPIENAYSLPIEAIVDILATDQKTGLSEADIPQRVSKYGLNKYEEQKKKSILLLLVEQFKSPIILLLVVAAVVSLLYQQWLEGGSIIGVIFITALLGFLMEMQARRSMQALKDMDVSVSKVRRDNALKEIPSENIVPGDIIVLEAGDMVLADARLIEINQLQIDESPLTGESLPITKLIEIIEKDASPADQLNMVFKGTSVTKGNAKAIVIGTAVHTELGKITTLVDNAQQTATPLEKKLQGLTKKLMWITAVFAVIFIGTGILQGKELALILETAIALAVAAIPEGLPIVSTIALTYGMLRMARKHVLIKRLASVETLGGINTIFTDKTGTLTENKIEVSSVSFLDETLEIVHDKSLSSENNKTALDKLLLISILCNDAVISKNKKQQVGDPMEVSLLKFAVLNERNVAEIKAEYKRIEELPFNSESKLMGTLHQNGKANFVAAKGAIEAILLKCNSVYSKDQIVPLTDKEKKAFLAKAEEIQAQGLRVLGFAYNESGKIDHSNFMQDLVFVGFIGFLDPPRMDVIGALRSCHKAGIKVIMITGDHPATALNIAEKIKLSETDNIVLTGKELDTKIDKKQLFAATIFARVTPKQKLDMVSLYQKRGDIVAMTGDGINDAPALKQADIGIAMGIRGTQVAIETAEMVLKDDSFKSIVSAIKQGRVIFQNIKRFLVYLLSCNLSEVLIVFLYGLLNFPFSILPMQILFLNLVTDIFPALALGMGKGNKLVMDLPPRNPKEPIATKKDWLSIVLYAIILAAPIFLVTYYFSYYLNYDAKVCNNITFLTLVLSQLWHVFNLPSKRISFFKNEVTQNKFVWSAILICIIIVMLFYWISPLNTIVGLERFDAKIWIIIVATSLCPVVLIQLLKRLLRIID